MRCSQCAAEVLADAVFCHQCGHRLVDTPTDASPREKFQAAAASLSTEDTVEKELWQGQFSKLAMIGSWIGAGLFSLVLLITAAASGFSGTGWLTSLIVIALAWLGLLGRLFYLQVSQHYYLTNLRFIHERGILWRETDRIEAIDIDDVSYQQGPVERLLGVGTIQIRSSDNTHPVMALQGIENAKDVAEMIDEVRRQERRKRGLHIESV